MPKLIQMQCVVCHRPASVNTNDPALYQSKIIRENFVCALCSPNVHKVKVVLTCTVCHQPFQTKILLVHKDKYTKDWTCPVCSSAGEPKRNVPKGTSVAVGCVWCKYEYGVCPHPEINCTMAKGFVPFNNADGLYSLKKECTIFSIDRVFAKRDDIHAFGYVLLYKTRYLLHFKNLVLIKQRVGSKKAFKTHVLVYRYVNGSVGRFTAVFDQEFERGVNWVVPTKKFIIEQRPDLVMQEVGRGR